MKRDTFLKIMPGTTGLPMLRLPMASMFQNNKKHIPVEAHVWVYAQYQPDYDVSSILPGIFSDMKYARMDGVETMHQPLRKEETTKLIAELIDQYQLPLTGTSYGEQCGTVPCIKRSWKMLKISWETWKRSKAGPLAYRSENPRAGQKQEMSWTHKLNCWKS